MNPKPKSFWAKSKKFLREVRAELRKVQWPSRRELGLYTVVVTVTVLFVSSLVWIIDSLLSGGLGLVIR